MIEWIILGVVIVAAIAVALYFVMRKQPPNVDLFFCNADGTCVQQARDSSVGYKTAVNFSKSGNIVTLSYDQPGYNHYDTYRVQIDAPRYDFSIDLRVAGNPALVPLEYRPKQLVTTRVPCIFYKNGDVDTSANLCSLVVYPDGSVVFGQAFTPPSTLILFTQNQQIAIPASSIQWTV